MAIDLSAVATVAEYKARVGRLTADTVDDTTIGTLLTGITRVVEPRLGLATGMLVPQTGLTFVFDAHGGSTLHLRDERGVQYLLRSITADSLKIDVSNDGEYDDYLLDTGDAWVQPRPVNAATLGAPYTDIYLRPLRTASLTSWPNAKSCVQIANSAWGWATTPGVVKERVIGMARELLDAERAGGAAVTQYDVEEAIERVPAARSLMAVLEREFSKKLPVFA